MVSPDTAIKIRSLRRARGFKSQAILAVAAGCSPNLIFQLEKFGHRTDPEIQANIARVLGVPVTEIWPALEEPTNGHHDEKEPTP